MGAPSPEQAGGRKQPVPFLRLTLLALCFALLFAGFMALGNWQVHRLAWKVALIHRVDSRIHAAPLPPPGPQSWEQVNARRDGYKRVRVRGHYLHQDETLVHTSTEYGYGYWLLTPLQTDAGFVVLINRGYIPGNLPEQPAYTQLPRPSGEVTITGLLRMSEPGGGFLRSNKPATGQWYSRDVNAIAAKLRLHNCAPYFIDAETSPQTGQWPAAGLTKVHFRNAHLSYAITWYALALGTLLGAGIVIRYEWRKRRA